jgi:hypothetical protein
LYHASKIKLTEHQPLPNQGCVREPDGKKNYIDQYTRTDTMQWDDGQKTIKTKPGDRLDQGTNYWNQSLQGQEEKHLEVEKLPDAFQHRMLWKI